MSDRGERSAYVDNPPHDGFDRTGWDLKRVWVEVWNGCVFISLAHEAPVARQGGLAIQNPGHDVAIALGVGLVLIGDELGRPRDRRGLLAHAR